MVMARWKWIGGPARAGAFFCGLPLILGCGSDELDAFAWSVYTEVTDIDCFDPEGVGWGESYEYRIQFDGANASLAIGEDQFATGLISGCSITYSSVVWGESRDGFESVLPSHWPV